MHDERDEETRVEASEALSGPAVKRRPATAGIDRTADGKAAAEWLPAIFDHLELRSWLRACFDAGRQHTRYFTHRWFARRIGRSPGYLSNVMAGRRRVTDGVAIADALGLDPESRLHLDDLIALEHATDAATRRVLLRRLSTRNRRGGSRQLDASWYAYLSEWYFVAIREMAGLAGFRPDPDWIGRHLITAVNPGEIADCLTVLENLELIRRDGDHITRGEPEIESITFGHEVRSAAVGSFHVQMLELAARAIDGVDRDLRHFNAKTISISARRVPALKQRINALLEEFSDDPAEDAPDAVYQLQVALFPLARVATEER